MKKITAMSIPDLIGYCRGGSHEEISMLISNKEFILSLPLPKLNIIFLNIKNNYKKILLSDPEIFDKIMSLPLNRIKKSIIDLSDDEIKEFIYNNSNLINSENGKKLLEHHLRNLSPEELTKILDNKFLKKVYNFNIINYIENNFNIDNSLKEQIEQNITNDKFNSLALFKIKNEIELLIYTKFNILVTTVITNNQIYINDVKIDYELVRNVNRKHIVSLINLLKEKEINIDNNKLFISVIKLYTIFGIDNSKKIINDFFTFATASSLKRVSYELFKENRREFRLKNQNKFYYHDMEIDFLNALNNNDFDFFKNFCLDTSNNYITDLINNTKYELQYLSQLNQLNKIKEIIDQEITKREEYYKKLDTEKFHRYYKETSRTNKISSTDIFEILSPVDIPYKLTKDGKIIIDDELNKFLLGNYKKDNDCLFRMVLNKHAFGLNKELYNIINNFEKIKEVISKNHELSLNSISDVIDISKVFLYNLKPNELDMTLETLSKILNSRKYCTEEPSVILERVMKIHSKRKEKIGSAIEKIKGEYLDVKYKIADFDSEDLLVSGIDTGSCFKIGGKGEDFFEYCLTSPLGIVFYLEHNNIKYVLPATINGNMLNINSIDPIIEDEIIFNKILSTIKHFSSEIINNLNNQVEIVTITDIHLNKFFNNNKYEPIEFTKYIPLNTSVYCDYNKKDVTNYIILKKENNTEPKYFNNTSLFLEKRNIPYVFSPNHEYDKERINIRINSISYSSIDYLNLTKEEKEKEKYYYSNKNIDDYIYIVGNKDWYIGIKKDRTIDRYILPYDKRAIEEYNEYLLLIEQNLTNNIKKK